MTALKATDLPKFLFGGLFNVQSTPKTEEKPTKNIPEKHAPQITPDNLFTKESVINELISVLDVVSEAMILLDVNNNIIGLNKAGEGLVGYKTTDVKGKLLNKLIRLYKDDNEIMDTEYTQKEYSANNLTLVSAKTISEKINLAVNLKATRIAGTEKIGINCLLTFYSLTEERKLEEMKANFVSVAAHELRTPITSLKDYLSLFMEENELKLNSDQKSLLQQMGVEIERMQILTENLLNVSRIERGTLSFILEQVDYTQLVKQSVEEFKNRALVKQISLVFERPKNPIPKIKIDKVRILEVLSNLINNAIVSTNPGGEIRVRLEVTGEEVITHILDNGSGIPQEDIPYLFNKFYRVKGLTIGKSPQGTGLGLYVSKAIIELHHGKMWVDSEVGTGSTFSFSLPI